MSKIDLIYIYIYVIKLEKSCFGIRRRSKRELPLPFNIRPEVGEGRMRMEANSNIAIRKAFMIPEYYL